jgi:Mg2+/Co2+ transporter CorB
VAIDLVGDAGVVYASLLVSALIVIYGEVVPKIVAVNQAEAFALRVAPLIRIIVHMCAPITKAIDWFAKLNLAFFPASMRTKNTSISAIEELRGAIDFHTVQDPLSKDARTMLRSVLDLKEVDVDQVMRHRKYVVTININDKPSTVLDQVLGAPYTRIPVWEGDPENIVGILRAKDLLRAVRAREGDMDSLNLREVASEPWFIPSSTPLFDQLQAFRERHEHFALVVDEYGALMGIVTLEDILEEIVGEISDEHDIAIEGVRPQGDGSYIIEGSVAVRDLNREFEWSLPDGMATTIAGLILHEARQIPEVGQHYNLFGFKCEILSRHRNQVTLVKVILPPASAQISLSHPF